jgi:hypothetical protein
MGQAGWQELAALTALLEASELQCQALTLSATGGTSVDVAGGSSGSVGQPSGRTVSSIQGVLQPDRPSVYRKLGLQLGGSSSDSIGTRAVGMPQPYGLGLQSAGAVAGGEEGSVAAVHLLDRAARERMQVRT